MKNMLSGLLMIAAIGVTAEAKALLVDIEDHGNYFSDTKNGLDWYDYNPTRDYNYLDLSNQFGAGGDFEGWRFATTEEFFTMFNTIADTPSGVTGVGQDVTSTENDAMFRWFELFLNFEDPENNDTLNSFNNILFPSILSATSSSVDILFLEMNKNDAPGTFYEFIISSDVVGTSATTEVVNVPSPATLPLIAIGLAGILMRRRPSNKRLSNAINV